MKVIQSDITTFDSDAIVNAANSSLLGGGGVDGGIHRAAGPDLVHECRLLGGCKPGEAKITGAYRLKATHIIHTVGPVWNGGNRGERETLRSCYENSLELCREHNLRTVTFPCISTGIYSFPKELAAEIAVNACLKFIGEHHIDITFCCFGQEDFNIYAEILST